MGRASFSLSCSGGERARPGGDAVAEEAASGVGFSGQYFWLAAGNIGSAAGITASTNQSLDDMESHYKLGSSGRNGWVYSTAIRSSTKIQTRRIRGRSIATYHICGLDELGTAPWLAVKGAKLLEKTDPALSTKVSFDFFGPANYYTNLFWRGRDHPLAHFQGYVPFNMVREQMGQSDLGLSTLYAKSKHYCVPSKVFQYISSGLPTWAVTKGGALKEFVQETGIGVHTSVNDPNAITNTLKSFIHEPDRLRESAEQGGRQPGKVLHASSSCDPRSSTQ